MRNWAIEKPTKKTDEKMPYRVRREAENKKAPHRAGLCCAKLFFEEQFRLVGGATSPCLVCLYSDYRVVYRELPIGYCKNNLNNGPLPYKPSMPSQYQIPGLGKNRVY